MGHRRRGAEDAGEVRASRRPRRQPVGVTVAFDGCDRLGAAYLRGTGCAARDIKVRQLTARVGGVEQRAGVNVTGLAGFLLAKAGAAFERRKPKDWYDLAFVLLHNDAGGPDSFDWDDYRDVEEDLIRVWNTYGQFEAWSLRNRTHREPPWKVLVREGDEAPDHLTAEPARVLRRLMAKSRRKGSPPKASDRRVTTKPVLEGGGHLLLSFRHLQPRVRGGGDERTSTIRVPPEVGQTFGLHVAATAESSQTWSGIRDATQGPVPAQRARGPPRTPLHGVSARWECPSQGSRRATRSMCCGSRPGSVPSIRTTEHIWVAVDG